MGLPDYIPNAKVFMTIKTYPSLSRKYGELVCTAGICNGELIRIYPVRFRDMDECQQYNKFQWTTVNLRKRDRNKDFRLESYSPDGPFLLGEAITTEKNGWERRMNIIDTVPMHHTFYDLIDLAKKPPYPSMFILKPKAITDFVIKTADREWAEDKMSYFMQPDFFDEIKRLILMKVPYSYAYTFTTDDGKRSRLTIEDWEISMLYINCLKKCDGDEKRANEMVRQKYFEDIAQNPNTFFFIGTKLKYHLHARNPFSIISVVHPSQKKININVSQRDLF